MEIKKLTNIFDQIVGEMRVNSEKAFIAFEKEWRVLTIEEREILKHFFIREAVAQMISNVESTETQMYWVAIMNIANDEDQQETPAQKLILTDNIRDIQVAKLFYDLKTHKYIDNTNSEIASVLQNVFNLNYDTVFSYLSEPKRFAKCKPLF